MTVTRDEGEGMFKVSGFGFLVSSFQFPVTPLRFLVSSFQFPVTPNP